MERESIRVTRSVVLPLAEIHFRFSRSSGPGGQHANTSETRVEAVFEVESSSALTDVQKGRVLARAGAILRAVAQDERSQLRNRELATERLVEQRRAALMGGLNGGPTRPARGATAGRLESNPRRGATKKLRRPPGD
ncbi:MAG: aminoacyl-tRNA hydrolase [Gaiellaceae bacterium]